MTQGIITVESGDYKAIFNIDNECTNGNNVEVKFIPELPIKENNENIIFVTNVVQFLIWYLGGRK